MSINKAFIQPLDRVAIALILLLCLLIGFLIMQGDVVTARVRDFSWQNQQIGAEDLSFTLTFSRPMDTKSVEENLKINPDDVEGKFSWAGRRMVYTLKSPATYGIDYQVNLQGAKDKFSVMEGKNRVIQPFTGSFRTRDRVIIYIGADSENQGQLVLYNLTQGQLKVLTPKDLIVMDFKPFPDGDKVLFSARSSKSQDLLEAQLYAVTTGIAGKSGEAQPAARVDLILDNKEYQNLKFDLSPDGETIVVQRGNKANPNDFGLWFMPATSDKSGEKLTPKRLQSQPGGDFIITPDSKAVAVAQGQGAAILPIQGDGNKPLDFLPQFGLVQAFSKDGSQAAMVKFNTDYTRDLFLVTNQGIQKSLLKTPGSIIDCQFYPAPASSTLYCLLTQLISQTEYVEQPYVVAIDLKTGEQKPLLVLPIDQRNVQMSISPDGSSLLFDQVKPQANTDASSAKTLTTDDGEAIATSSLWFMPLLPLNDAAINSIRPEKLPLVGFHPRWLP